MCIQKIIEISFTTKKVIIRFKKTTSAYFQFTCRRAKTPRDIDKLVLFTANESAINS